HQRSLRAESEIADHIAPLLRRAEALENSALEIGILMRSVVVDPTPSRLEAFDRSVVLARARLNALADSLKDSSGEARFAPLAETMRRYLGTAEDYVERRRNGPQDLETEVQLTEVRESLLEYNNQFRSHQYAKL